MTKTQQRKGNSLQEACALEPVPGSGDNSFTARIAWDWCGPQGALGGYLTTLIFTAARRYMLAKHPALPQPDPIASHVQFVHGVTKQTLTVRLTIKEISLGARVSILQISLATTLQLCVLAVLTMGNLATEQGVSLPARPTIPKHEIPDRERDCMPDVPPEWMRPFVPMAFQGDNRILKGARGAAWDARFGRNVREKWCARTDADGFDVLSLGCLLDSFMAAPGNYFPDRHDNKVGVGYPTLCMSSEIKKDPKGTKWLFMKITAHEIKNGRFDTDVYVVDEEGELVALSKHVSLITEVKGKSLDMSKAVKL